MLLLLTSCGVLRLPWHLLVLVSLTRSVVRGCVIAAGPMWLIRSIRGHLNSIRRPHLMSLLGVLGRHLAVGGRIVVVAIVIIVLLELRLLRRTGAHRVRVFATFAPRVATCIASVHLLLLLLPVIGWLTLPRPMCHLRLMAHVRCRVWVVRRLWRHSSTLIVLR